MNAALKILRVKVKMVTYLYILPSFESALKP